MTHEERYAWLLALQPGMFVYETSRGSRQRIKSITDVWNITFPGSFISGGIVGTWRGLGTVIERFRWQPERYDALEARLQDAMMLLRCKKLLDREVTLEDGTTWSALYCLLPVL